MKFVHEYEADHDAKDLYCKLLEAYQHNIQAELETVMVAWQVMMMLFRGINTACRYYWNC